MTDLLHLVTACSIVSIFLSVYFATSRCLTVCHNKIWT